MTEEGFTGNCPTCGQRHHPPHGNRFFLPVSVLLEKAREKLGTVGYFSHDGHLHYNEMQLEHLLEAKTLIILLEHHAFNAGWDKSNSLQIQQETGDDLGRRLQRLEKILCPT